MALRTIWKRGRYELLVNHFTVPPYPKGHTLKLPGNIWVGWLISGEIKTVFGISAGVLVRDNGRTIILLRDSLQPERKT